MIKGQGSGLGQEDGWEALLNCVCTQQIKHSRHTAQRKSYLSIEEGKTGRVDEAGWEGRTEDRKNKQSQARTVFPSTKD